MNAKLDAKRLERLAIGLAILAFAAQASYFAAVLRNGVAPDELYHMTVARVRSSSWAIRIRDGIDTWEHGPISRYPYLYHWLLGRVLWLKDVALGETANAAWRTYAFVGTKDVDFARFARDLTVLRYVNVLLSTAGFVAAAKFLRASGMRLAGTLTVLACVGTSLMFGLMSGVVSYDNLSNPLAITGFFLLAILARRPGLGPLLALGLVVLCGNLTKAIFLPLGLGFVPVGIFLARGIIVRRAAWRKMLRRPLMLVGIVALLFLIRENVMLYGVNYLRYGEIYPSCERVLGREICAREDSSWQRDADVLAAFGATPRLAMPDYLLHYVATVEVGISGISSHKTLVPTFRERLPLRLGLGIAALATLYAAWLRREIFRDRVWGATVFVCLVYIATVIGENRETYMHFGLLGLGMQARYVFPAFVAMTYAAHRPLFALLQGKRAALVAAILIALYSTQGLRIWFAHDDDRAGMIVRR